MKNKWQKSQLGFTTQEINNNMIYSEKLLTLVE